MSKLAALGAGGAGTAAVTVGGFYIWQRSTKEENVDLTPVTLTFDNLGNFRNGHGGKCAESVFSSNNIDFSSSGGDTVDASFFGSAPSGDASNTKGCLIIDWIKNTDSTQNNKWGGTFTWTWAFVNGDKGFITFNMAKTSVNGNDKRFDITGGVYLLENKDSEGTKTWEMKWKKEVESNKKIEQSDFENQFPKSKSSAVKIGDNNYWNFVEGSGSMNDIFDAGIPKIKENKQWNWAFSTTGTNGNIEGWSENLTWFDHIYGTSPLNLGNQLQNFTGNWTLQQ